MEQKESKNVGIVNKIVRISWILIFAIITVILFTTANIIDSGLVEDAVDLHTLIADEEDVEGVYATITLAYLPYNFATGDTGDNVLKYYFAMDEDGYMYIIRITDDTYEYLSSMAGDEGELTYEITGYTFSTSEDLKTIAIESYNELIEDELLTEDNFEGYMGSVYIDEINTHQTTTTTVLYIIAKVLAAITIILIVAYLVLNIKNQNNNVENENK